MNIDNKQNSQLLVEACRQNPANTELLLSTIGYLCREGDFDSALAVLAIHLERDPDNRQMLELRNTLQNCRAEALQQTVENLHALWKTTLRGQKVLVDTLEWEIMGGLAIDAAVLPKLADLGYLKAQNPIFVSGDAAHSQLVKMIAREVPVASLPSLGNSQFLGYTPEKSEYFLLEEQFKKKLFGDRFKNLFDDCFNFHHSTNGRAYYPQSEFDRIMQSTAKINFTDEETAYAENFMKTRMGVTSESWWACVFARDSGYYKEDENSPKAFRNVSLESFRPAIERVLAHGGHVIRVGSHSNVALNLNHPKVYDYAFNDRDQLMDLFLIARARFLIGSPSGLTQVAFIFGTKSLNVQTINFYPSWGHLFIPKKPRCPRTKEMLSLERFLDRTYRNPNFWPLWEDGLAQREQLGVEYVDNSEEEIDTAVDEFMKRQSNSYNESLQESVLRQKFERIVRDVPGPYRFNTPIATSFLLQNQYLLKK